MGKIRTRLCIVTDEIKSILRIAITVVLVNLEVLPNFARKIIGNKMAVLHECALALSVIEFLFFV